MKSLSPLFHVSITILMLSCNAPEKKENGLPAAVNNSPQPDIEVAAVTTKFNEGWGYLYRLNFTADYSALDSAGKKMDRGAFLQSMTSGRYFPVRMTGGADSLCYRLSPVGAKADAALMAQVARIGNELWAWHQKEGQPLPQFKFTDVNGTQYNAGNCRGKWVLLKCWFIGCKPCVAEMPLLNAFVQQHQQQNRLVFVSLALDAADPLRKFLKTTAFDYAVVPQQTEYMKQLGVTAFPTHLLVDTQGRIARISSRAEDMLLHVRRQLRQ